MFRHRLGTPGQLACFLAVLLAAVLPGGPRGGAALALAIVLALLFQPAALRVVRSGAVWTFTALLLASGALWLGPPDARLGPAAVSTAGLAAGAWMAAVGFSVFAGLIAAGVPVETARPGALKPGKNTLTVVAVDAAGNGATVTKEILVYKRMTIQLTIDNKEPIIDDEKQPELEAAPFISGGRTMVPVRFIAEAYGAKVDYDATTKGITITLDETVIAMQVGVKTAYVNGKTYTIDAPPVIVNGRTFVPIRFISEMFNATVTYDESTRTVTIVRDFLPK